MPELLGAFFLAPPASSILGWTALYLAAAWVLGRWAGFAFGESFCLGFMVLGGSAHCAYFLARQLALPTWMLAVLVPCLAAGLATVLRRWVVPPPSEAGREDSAPFLAAWLPLAVMVWFTQMMTPDPAAAFSSHQAWIPLYLQESMARGHFITEAEMAFAPGFLASLYYTSDLMGLVAWAGALGDGTQLYNAYLAGSITGGIVVFALLCWGLRGNIPALAGFVVTALLVFRFGAWTRLLLGNNWGDTFSYLGGTAALYFLCRGDGRLDGKASLALAGMASIFAIVSRNYHILFAFTVCACGLALCLRDRRTLIPPPAWLAVAGLGIMFSAREVVLFLNPPSVYYSPAVFKGDGLAQILGSLRNFSSGDWLRVLPNILYLPLGAAVLAMARPGNIPVRHVVLPMLLGLPLFLLLAVTGYASPLEMSKPYIPILLLPLWLPWHLLRLCAPGPIRPRMPARTAAIGALGLAVGIPGALAAMGKLNHPLLRDPAGWAAWAQESYRPNNGDLMMGRALDAALGRQGVARLAGGRILYMHYEPGLGLREYIGGHPFNDLDYWSVAVQAEIRASASLAELVGRLGYPAIYFSFGDHMGYGFTQPDETWRKFAADLHRIRGDEPWVERIVTSGRARLVITRAP